MKRQDALNYVSYCVDDALSQRSSFDMPRNARLIGWQCGFEPLFVAVWSYLDMKLDDDEAVELATDFLQEREWFSDNANPPEPDYIF